MFYYEVAPTKIVRAGSDVLTYHTSVSMKIGQIVQVSVGKTLLIGVIMRSVAQPTYTTKEIHRIVHSRPIPKPLLETLVWISTYYATPLATCLQTALPRGITTQRRARAKHSMSARRIRTHFLLNSDQSRAIEQIESASTGTVLLHGITGSGKTAIYLELARRSIASGKSVIVVVPEIALTSQLIAEFSVDFPDLIATHSRQTDAERHIAWQSALESTTPRVAIGPRSALFLPLAKLGTVIIDEAHEPSLKQDQSPRYSALRVASVLARNHTALCLQGSATPLVSEYYLAQQATHPIVTLVNKARIDATASKTAVIDMTRRESFTQHRFLSDHLLAAIRDNLGNHRQSLIFHNRRGSASTTLCESCGWSAICPRCIVPYTLHSDTHTLRCHICNTSTHVPTSCPTCRSTQIIHKGIGTKLIEDELRRLFPKATIARFDADSNSDETIEKRYQAMYDGVIDIIIGTQVVAKGLDLPHLRTVGVVQADAGLSLPDFMSTERTFQLLAQVVGRVGRSHHDSEVVIQTYQPNAPAIQCGTRQDFEAFYQATLFDRKRAKFPPFVHLLKLTCVYKTEAIAIRNSKQFAAFVRQHHPTTTIFGPTPAFYEHQRDTYRWQIIIKSSKRSELLAIIQQLPKTHWQFDIDPMTLL